MSKKTSKIKKKEIKLKTFRVLGQYTTHYEAEVEAKNKDEAWEKAEQLDNNEWEECDDYCGDIEVGHVEELEE